MAYRVSAATAAPRGRRHARGCPAPRRRRSTRSGRPRLPRPGLIAANAGNDAGGIATYSVGRRQVRLRPAVDDGGHHRLADRRPGDGGAHGSRHRQGPGRADPRAVRRALVVVRHLLGAVANIGICISEFVGIGAALGLAGVPRRSRCRSPRSAVWLLARPRLIQDRRADLRADDDPVLRLPDRRGPRPPATGATSATRSSSRTSTTPRPTCSCSSPPPARRSRRSCSSTSSRRWSSGASASTSCTPSRPRCRPARSSPTCRRLHHHRHRRHALRPRRAQHHHGGPGGQGAGAVRRPLRRAAVRRRAARRQPAGGGDPPGHRGVRDRRDVRLREGHRPAPARGARSSSP